MKDKETEAREMDKPKCGHYMLIVAKYNWLLDSKDFAFKN